MAAVAGDERLLEILRQVGYRSVIVVPLPARNGVIGTMTLVMAESERKYDERSLRFAERLGVQMALAIETAQLYTQLSEAWHGQRLAVETLQRGLAPDPLPEITDVELAAHYEIGGAEQVGGDWYDVFENESGNVCFVIGDVVGRGVPAVASMSRYRNSLRTLLMEGHSPGHALTTLNRLNTRAGSRGAGFATVACLTYRRSDRLLSWSTAGHPPALICDVNGVRALWETAEVPLDVQPEHEYQDYSDQLRPGAMLVLYTDGLIERRGEAIDRSLQRLIDELENAPAGAKETVSHLLRVLPASPSEDDVAVLVARLH